MADLALSVLGNLVHDLRPLFSGYDTIAWVTKFIAAYKQLNSASTFMAKMQVVFTFLGTVFDDVSAAHASIVKYA